MPRRSHARDDEYMYDEPEPIPHRSRRSRRFEEDMRRGVRPPSPPSPPPPMEEFERLDVRDRSPPELLRESFDRPRHRRPVSMRREPEDIGLPPRELMRDFERVRGDVHRRRGRPRPREIVEEEYITQEESDRRLSESDSDGDILPPRRRERPLPPRGYDTGDEFPPPSRGHKEDRRARRPMFEEDEVLPGRHEMRGGHRKTRGHHHRAHTPVPPPLPESGYQTEVEEEEEEDFLIPRGRRHMPPPGREHFEEEDIHIQNRGMSSSPEPRIPSPVRMPPGHRDFDREHLHIREDFEMPRAPRAPSPEVSFEKVRDRHRKESGRRGPREEVVIERRDKTVPPTPIRRLTPEPPTRLKEEIIMPRSRPRSLEREKDLLLREQELRNGDIIKEREVVETFDGPDLGPPIQERAPKGTADEWAIVNAVPPSARDSLKDVSAIKPPRPIDRMSKFTMSDEILSEGEKEFDRGKIARRYVGIKNRRDSLWTEITKDLVVREAIERSGYEYEETASSYYVFSYLQYDDVSALVELSEDIRRTRRRRIHELERDRASLPPPPLAVPDRKAPLLMDRPLSPPHHRPREGRRMKERDRELVVEESRGRPRPGRR